LFKVQGSPPSAEFLHEMRGKFKSCSASGLKLQARIPQPTQHTVNMAMKRKLNSDDVPEVVATEAGETQTATPAKATFDSLNLDARILQAITREKFTEPTPVQAATLPLALSGKDILGMSCEPWWKYIQRLTPPSPLQDRLRQDSGLPLPNHPLHPPPQGNLNKIRKDRLSTHSGSHERACIPSHLHDQNLHNFLRARSSR